MRWIKPFLAFFSAGGPAVAAPYLDTVPPGTEKPHPVDRMPKRFVEIPKVTLYPVIESSILTKRANKFALMDEITLLWKNGSAVARLKGNYPDSNQKVTNMETFGDLLNTIDCTPPRVSLSFKDKEAFEAAKVRWGWVNQKEERHIVLIVNHAKCAENQRKPYNITGIDYDESSFKAYMSAEEIPFNKAFHTGGIRVENGVGSNLHSRAGAALEPRQRWSLPISVDRVLPGVLFQSGSQRLECTRCVSSGQMGAAFEADWDRIGFLPFFVPDVAFFEFWGQDLASDLELSLSGEKAFTHGDHLALPAGGLNFNIPPFVVVQMGLQVGVGYNLNFKSAGEVTWGASSRIPGRSYYKKCVHGPCEDETTGWDIQVKNSDPKISGNLTADTEVFAYTALHGEASLFGSGYQVGLAVKAPDLKGTFSVGNNVCSNPLNHVKMVLTAGLELYAYVGDPITAPDKWPIRDKTVTLAEMCSPPFRNVNGKEPSVP